MPIGRARPSLQGPDKPVFVAMGVKSHRTTRRALAASGEGYLAAAARYDWTEMQTDVPLIDAPVKSSVSGDYIMLWTRTKRLPPAMPEEHLLALRKDAEQLHMHELLHEVNHIYPLRERVREAPTRVSARLALVHALAGRVPAETLRKKFEKAAALGAPHHEKLQAFIGKDFAAKEMAFLVEAERVLRKKSLGAQLRAYFKGHAAAKRQELAQEVSKLAESGPRQVGMLDHTARRLIAAPHDPKDVEGRSKEFVDWASCVPRYSSAHLIFLAAHAEFTGQDAERLCHAEALYAALAANDGPERAQGLRELARALLAVREPDKALPAWYAALAKEAKRERTLASGPSAVGYILHGLRVSREAFRDALGAGPQQDLPPQSYATAAHSWLQALDAVPHAAGEAAYNAFLQEVEE